MSYTYADLVKNYSLEFMTTEEALSIMEDAEEIHPIFPHKCLKNTHFKKGKREHPKRENLELYYHSVATEHLKCGWSALRSAGNAGHTLEVRLSVK